MTYTFKVTNRMYCNIIRVITDGKVVGILKLEQCYESGRTMIHMPYCCHTLSFDNMRFIWLYITRQLPYTDYIAYVGDNKPTIQRLALQLGFIKDNNNGCYCYSVDARD